MKKILIDANPVVPFLAQGKMNGIGRTCMELIGELGRIKDSLPFKIELFTQNIKGVTAERLNSGLKCRHLYFRNTEPWAKVSRALHLRELMSRYDLQHITHNFEYIRNPSRCIVTIHDTMFFSYPESFLGAERNRIIVPQLAKKAAHIITISENSKREIMQYMDIPEDKITVIPWGVNHNLLYPHTPTTNRWSGKAPYFTSVSCDKGRKNTISIIQAFAKFAKNSPSHHLVLVWRNPSEEAIRLSELPQLKGRLHFTCNLSNEELSDLYAGATASFFPSLYEGFGLPIIESMACGVPCVTSRNSSLEEVGGDAAIYVEPLDIDAISTIMEKFESHAYDMEYLKAASLRQAAKFTWQHCAISTIDVYKKCLEID